MNRITIALMLSTALALAGCNNSNNATNNTADENVASYSGVGTESNAEANGATPAAANVDQQFLTDAIKGDNSEVTLGQMAQQKGASQGVKDFGKTLETDHSKAKDQASALAQQAGMTVPTEMADEAKQEQKKLEGLSGAAFDKEFASYMVTDHKKDIAKFETQAKSSDTQTAQLAQQTLPTLKKHLQMAESLEKK